VDRTLLLVAAADGLLHLPYPLSGGPAVTGDWVWIGPNRAGDRQILAVLPRRSELSRKRAFEDSSAEQVLAANMDTVGVVVPVDRPLTHNRLERTLVAAWDSGATPLVIVTKGDLAQVADDVVGKVILQAAGVDVVTTSAENGDGIDELMAHIRSRQVHTDQRPGGPRRPTDRRGAVRRFQGQAHHHRPGAGAAVQRDGADGYAGGARIWTVRRR